MITDTEQTISNQPRVDFIHRFVTSRDDATTNTKLVDTALTHTLGKNLWLYEEKGKVYIPQSVQDITTQLAQAAIAEHKPVQKTRSYQELGWTQPAYWLKTNRFSTDKHSRFIFDQVSSALVTMSNVLVSGRQEPEAVHQTTAQYLQAYQDLLETVGDSTLTRTNPREVLTQTKSLLLLRELAKLPRKLLRPLAGLMLAGIMVACGREGESTTEPVFSTPSPQPTSTLPAPTESPTSQPTSTPVPTETPFTGESLFVSGVRVDLNKEGLPISYTISETGETITYSPDEIEIFRQKKANAIQSQEHDVADIIPIKSTIFIEPTPIVPSPAHPDKEAPTDILTNSELAERGITIIQTDDVKLHLRPSAFMENQPLADYITGGDQKLIIVLVPGAVVTSGYLTDTRYDNVRGLLNETQTTITEYRQQQIEYYQQELDSARLRLAEARKTNDPDLDYLRQIVLLWKEHIFSYQDPTIITDEHIFELINLAGRDIAGMHCPPGYVSRVLNGELGDNTTVIFTSVGKTNSTRGAVEILFDEKGDVNLLESATSSGSFDARPEAAHSHPSPDDFTLNPQASIDNPGSYPYAAQTASQTFRHETRHHRMPPSDDPFSDIHEYKVDMAAMDDIRKAWNQWQESGWVDDSLYWVVWETNGQWIYGKAPVENVAT